MTPVDSGWSCCKQVVSERRGATAYNDRLPPYIDNGARFVTYAIEGEEGSGTVQVNGAAARVVRNRDNVIVASFAAYDDEELEPHLPVIVHVDDRNEVVEVNSHPAVLAE